MKILTISSHYPPYHLGGYELRCKNIMDGLAAKGHDILILTSQKEKLSSSRGPISNYAICRKLHYIRTGSLIERMTMHRWSYVIGIFLVFMRELWIDWQDSAIVDKQIAKFGPDLIYLGHLAPLSKSLLPYFEDCAIPIVYDEGGSGLIDAWNDKGIWYRFIEKTSTAPLIVNRVASVTINILAFLSHNRLKTKWKWPYNMKIIFNSELNYRNAIKGGVPTERAEVVYSGIDTRKFVAPKKEKFDAPLQLLVPGRIEPRKGQLDAVKLLSKLLEAGIDAKLTFVGKKWISSYYQQLLDEIGSLGLENRVSIQPMIGQNELIMLYCVSDVCFFPSYFHTGFSRIPLEAMACECIIVSYGNEGSNEVIRDGETGLLVNPTDYAGITSRIKSLIDSIDIAKSIWHQARKKVEENYSLEIYINRIESIIKTAANIN